MVLELFAALPARLVFGAKARIYRGARQRRAGAMRGKTMPAGIFVACFGLRPPAGRINPDRSKGNFHVS